MEGNRERCPVGTRPDEHETFDLRERVGMPGFPLRFALNACVYLLSTLMTVCDDSRSYKVNVGVLVLGVSISAWRPPGSLLHPFV